MSVYAPGRWLHHFPLGGLGCALPFALGAGGAAGHADRGDRR